MGTAEVDDARRRIAAWWFGADPRRQRILVVGHDLTRTGAPLVLHGLVEHFAREPDVELRMLALSGGPLEAVTAVPLLIWDALPCDGAAASQLLCDTAAARRPDLVICNTVLTAPLAELFAGHGVPVLALVHELSSSIELFFGRAMIDRMMAAADVVVLPSQFTEQDLVERFALDRRKLAVIPPGCRLAEQRTQTGRQDARAELAARFGIDAGAQLVVGCGTITQRKGCDLFVQLARLVGAATAPIQFVWIGEGDPFLLRWCQHDIRRLGLEASVRFIGPLDEPAAVIAAADLFVLPSREDPFPLVVLEALTLGVPVVAFASAGGAPEAIGDGGRVVPYLDIAAMAAEIDSILGDPALRDRLGRQARASGQRYGCDAYYRRLRALAREIRPGAA